LPERGSGQQRAAGQDHYREQKRFVSALRQVLFRTPAGLADGLALKELARFASPLEVKLAPKPGSPAPLTRVRRGGHSTPSSPGKPSVVLGGLLPTTIPTAMNFVLFVAAKPVSSRS